jgi:hypothetical protein
MVALEFALSFRERASIGRRELGAAQASFKKSFVLHTAAQSALNASRKLALATMDGGRLSSLTLYPTDARARAGGRRGQRILGQR